MRRVGFILLVVLSASLLTPSLTALAAQATPTGDPASTEVEANVGSFFNIVINRINRHDRRVFDQMDQDPMIFLFGTTDKEADGLFNQKLPAKLEFIDDVHVQPDGTIKAVVSISGLLVERGYFTYDFTLAEDGASYRITHMEQRDPVFSDDAKVTDVTLTFNADGTTDLAPMSVSSTSYLLFKIDIQDGKPHLPAIFAADANVNEPTQALTIFSIQDGSATPFATTDLEPGQYTFFDLNVAPARPLAMLTVEQS